MRNFNIESGAYVKILEEVGSFLSSLNLEYVNSYQQTDQLKKGFFAFGIIKTLSQNSNLLNYLNQHSRQDLIDSINIHSNKYIEAWDLDATNTNMTSIFKSNIVLLLQHLKSDNIIQSQNLTHNEFEIVRDLVKNIIHICRTLFAEQAYKKEALDKLQAMTIAFNLHNIPYTLQVQLIDKLLLIKELWQLGDKPYEPNDNFQLFFYLNISKILSNLKFTNESEAFDGIITLFVDDHQVLQSFSNEELLNLYDRLSNIEFHNPLIDNLLHKLHHESQFRYGYNRLHDTSYELLKRFQSYDAILQQIEFTSFSIAESFLLRNNIFAEETIALISKHTDNIKAIGIAKASEIVNTLNKIKSEISASNNDDQTLQMFNSVESKFFNNLDSHVLKKYSELTHFTISSLKAKYIGLFQNIKNLIDKEIGYTEFLQQTIARKLSQDYYVSSLSGSVDKLKLMAKERSEIFEQLSEIDFVEVFSQEHFNKISSLNFRKQLINIEIKSKSDYVHAIIMVLVANFSASQLESIYRPLIKDNLNKTEIIIKQELIKQIKQRTSLSKLIISLFKGNKKEFNKLKGIENSLNMNLENIDDTLYKSEHSNNGQIIVNSDIKTTAKKYNKSREKHSA